MSIWVIERHFGYVALCLTWWVHDDVKIGLQLFQGPPFFHCGVLLGSFSYVAGVNGQDMLCLSVLSRHHFSLKVDGVPRWVSLNCEPFPSKEVVIACRDCFEKTFARNRSPRWSWRSGLLVGSGCGWYLSCLKVMNRGVRWIHLTFCYRSQITKMNTHFTGDLMLLSFLELAPSV